MEDPQRPLPPRSPRDHVRAWVDWFGYGRIVGSAAAVLIVCGGAYWLVRTPPPPTEVLLPVASTSTVTSSGVSPSDSAGGGGTGTDAVAAAPTGAAAIVVHVAGAVVTPGVYELADGSRVEGALAAADGPLPDADPNALNLAAPLVDGSRIYVPLIGEEVAPLPAAPASPDLVDGTVAVIDVNEATAAELEHLPGVGPATATAIVAERDRNGPFLSIDDLDRVPGIGPGKIEALRDLVTT